MASTLKDEAKKFLADVPEEHVFRCCDGSVFKNLQELKDGLDSMTDESFACHSNAEKKDFSNWVRDVIGDEKLATNLQNAATRAQAAKQIASKISTMKKRLA